MRTCPHCKIDLKQKEYKGLRLDECPECSGIWFDRDELRKAKDNTDDDMRWLDYDPFIVNKKSNLTKTSKLCPLCNQSMNEVTYDKSKVKVDICSICKGVWLDKNEIDKIFAYLQDLIVTKTSKKYAEATIEELKEIVVGPESKLSEIRDFIVVANLLQLRYVVEHPWIINLSNAIYTYWPLK
ncbi:MAG: zf-TFIIB domain-containing protein [bacterium]|nr:zf-TFIIB domain-containing protein [bacterium]